MTSKHVRLTLDICSIPRKERGEVWSSAWDQFFSAFSTTKPHSNKFPGTPQRLKTFILSAEAMNSLCSTSEQKMPFETNFSALTLREDLVEEWVKGMNSWNESCSRATARILILVGSWAEKLHHETDVLGEPLCRSSRETLGQAGLAGDTNSKVPLQARKVPGLKAKVLDTLLRTKAKSKTKHKIKKIKSFAFVRNFFKSTSKGYSCLFEQEEV